MTRQTPIKTVFFDAGGTLFRVRGGVGQAYARIASGFDSKIASMTDLASRLELAFGTAFRRREPMVFPGAALDRLPELERGWWLAVVRETFQSLEVPFPRLEEFFETVYGYFATEAAWELEPGCRETLALLRSRGCQLGVISNFDSRLGRVLGSLGIRDFFSTVTFSTACGAAKPDPAIFRRALRDADTPAGASLHVGDDEEDDWQGALAAGMRAVVYDPRGLHRRRLETRVETLAEVSRFLV